MHRSTQEDSKEVYFIFLWIFILFSTFFQSLTDFPVIKSIQKKNNWLTEPGRPSTHCLTLLARPTAKAAEALHGQRGEHQCWVADPPGKVRASGTHRCGGVLSGRRFDLNPMMGDALRSLGLDRWTRQRDRRRPGFFFKPKWSHTRNRRGEGAGSFFADEGEKKLRKNGGTCMENDMERGGGGLVGRP
jgi:hypothetical protein